nr:phosphotransferase [Kibdelosporangium phytohabitans]
MSGGFRNHNVRLVTDIGEEYVLRRFLHDNTCAVETALAERLTGVVPVAEVLADDPDGALTGRPAMLSRFVPGVLLTEALPASAETHQLGHAVGAILAAIGTVTFAQPGFFTSVLVPDGTDTTTQLPAFVERCLAEGNADQAFSAGELDALRQHAADQAALLTPLRGARQLVHSDFNPKNLLVARRDGTWVVTAVLDWEFAFAGAPLVDVGNMLRFQDEIPPDFADGFIAGFAAAGGDLPEDWRPVSQALDLFALADFLTRPPGNPFFGKAVAVIRRQLQT